MPITSPGYSTLSNGILAWQRSAILRHLGYDRLAAEHFFEEQHKFPQKNIEEIHRTIVPRTLSDQSALLLNHTPGLLLIDNSNHHPLYHAKTCRFDNRNSMPNQQQDNPMYTFNEVGLMHYIDSLDEQRGMEHRDEEERDWVRHHMGLA